MGKEVKTVSLTGMDYENARRVCLVVGSVLKEASKYYAIALCRLWSPIIVLGLIGLRIPNLDERQMIILGLGLSAAVARILIEGVFPAVQAYHAVAAWYINMRDGIEALPIVVNSVRRDEDNSLTLTISTPEGVTIDTDFYVYGGSILQGSGAYLIIGPESLPIVYTPNVDQMYF